MSIKSDQSSVIKSQFDLNIIVLNFLCVGSQIKDSNSIEKLKRDNKNIFDEMLSQLIVVSILR